MLRTIPRPALLITAGALLLALILALDAIPFLRGGYGWRWPYDPVALGRLLPLVAGVTLYVAGAWLLVRGTGRAGPVLAWAVLGATVLPLLVIRARHDDVLYELFARTAAPFTTGQHHAGAVIDWDGDTWHDWPDVMARMDEVGNHHVALSPPGLPLAYAGLNAALDHMPALAGPLRDRLLPYQCHNYALLGYSAGEWASAWFGMLMPLWAALAALPLYGAARRLVGRGPARWAALWWPLVPALALFAPTWNTAYPLFSLGAFWLLLIGLDRATPAPVSIVALLTAGTLAGLLVFANLSTVPLPGLFGFYTLLAYLLIERRAPDAPSWPRPVVAGLWVGAGFALPWLAAWVAVGHSPLAIVTAAMGNHLELDRPYLPWLWLHAWEWALFCGPPLVALWLLAAARRRTRWQTGGTILALSLACTLAALVLSGTARGETGRVWLFFSPFAVISAAGALDAFSRARVRASWGAITAAQAALLVVLAATLDVIDTDFTPPPTPPDAADVGRAADVAFGPLRLVGWDAAADRNAVALTLAWEPRAQVTTPYWFSALLVRPDGAPLAKAHVWQPFETRYPATCWAPGHTITETVALPLPDDAPGGEWWVSLAVLAEDGPAYTRLAASAPGSATDTQAGLGPIAVP